MKLPRTFYMRLALLIFELFTIVTGSAYLFTDEAEFSELGGEVCKKHESITGYCLETEDIKFEKLDPIYIMLFIMFLTFSSIINLNAMHIQYKKAKYGFKSTW